MVQGTRLWSGVLRYSLEGLPCAVAWEEQARAPAPQSSLRTTIAVDGSFRTRKERVLSAKDPVAATRCYPAVGGSVLVDNTVLARITI